jgi:hypothetical protein
MRRTQCHVSQAQHALDAQVLADVPPIGLERIQPTVTAVKAATPTTINTTPASCSRVNRSRRNT